MKRNLVTLLLALAMVSPAAAFAAEDTNVTTSAPAGTEEAVEEAVMTDVFTKSEEFGGYIDSNNSLVLNISDDTVIVDEAGNTVSKDELDGKILEVHYSFATMSLPAQTNPTKIVVKEAKAPEESVMTAIFVKSNDFGDYIDVDNTLALNISDETEIVDEQGNKVSKDDLHLSTLEVHYTFTTMSIPAQTNPTKIVVKDVPKATAADFAKPVESNESVMTEIFVKSNETGDYMNLNNTLVLNIGEDTKIVDEAGNAVSKDDLHLSTLEVHYGATTRSIPAQTTPSLIVVKEGPKAQAGDFARPADYEAVLTSVFVKSNDFGDYIDVNNTLALNISDDTEIVDEEGNAVSKDDLHLSTLEVHYGATTMSIPAQTTPTKIVVKNVPKAQAGNLAKENVAVFIKGETEYTSEYTVKEEKNYVPFRAVAEGLGINVIWSDTDRSITLEDNDVTTNIKVDGNADLLLENGSTFVITNALEKYFGGFGVTVELR